MKASFFLFFLPFLIFPGADWVLQKDRDGIKIWVADEAEFYRLQARTTLKGSLEDFEKLFEDFYSHYNWAEGLKTIKVIEDRDDEWTLLLQFKMPFPLKDRYQLIDCKRQKNNQVLSYSIEDSKHIIEDGYGVRMVDVEGYWLVQEVDGGNIQITQQGYANPKLKLPKSWAKDKVVDEMFSNFYSIKTLINNQRPDK